MAEPTARTQLRRRAERGSHDRETIHAILDEGLICHVAFARGDEPALIPMVYARLGETLYLHGSTANRALRALRDGAEACIVVTLLDGLVLARSAFHHSVCFRSVVVYGKAREVKETQEKLAALHAVVEHVVPGRGADARGPSPKELLQTRVLAVPLDEASAKQRSGGPIDDEQDYALPVWAGEIPLRLEPQEPIDDPRLPAGTPRPAYVTHYRRLSL